MSPQSIKNLLTIIHRGVWIRKKFGPEIKHCPEMIEKRTLKRSKVDAMTFIPMS